MYFEMFNNAVTSLVYEIRYTIAVTVLIDKFIFYATRKSHFRCSNKYNQFYASLSYSNEYLGENGTFDLHGLHADEAVQVLEGVLVHSKKGKFLHFFIF